VHVVRAERDLGYIVLTWRGPGQDGGPGSPEVTVREFDAGATWLVIPAGVAHAIRNDDTKRRYTENFVSRRCAWVLERNEGPTKRLLDRDDGDRL
jgi:hypothetical protein